MELFMLFFWLGGLALLIGRRDFMHTRKTSLQNQYSIVIPARNEEQNIQTLLSSLCPQLDEHFEVIVVNDHSSDQTAQVAAQYPITLLDALDLPEGWTGKSWACFQGVQVAQYEHLMFLDADTCLKKDGLQRLCAQYEHNKKPLSVQPYHTISHLYEMISIPFNIIEVMADGSDRRMQKGATVFYGPCHLLSRAVYEAIGTHRATQGAIIEDLALGKLLVQHGYPPKNYCGKGAIAFQMYPDGIGSLFEGWTKNIASGALSLDLVSLFLIVGWICGCFGAIAAFFPHPLQAENAFFYFAYAFQYYAFARMVSNLSWLGFCLFPVQMIVFAFLFVTSLIKRSLFRKVRWKGRTITIR
ncbi:MAG: glycosyltransferase [Erysipelotrichaceae bacterium]